MDYDNRLKYFAICKLLESKRLMSEDIRRGKVMGEICRLIDSGVIRSEKDISNYLLGKGV